jgi:methylglutaconyl-CoA hydratase/polyketide biosynthesis enoyl-CoA hydratase PksH
MSSFRESAMSGVRDVTAVVDYQYAGGVARVRLQAPETGNALSAELLGGLHEACRRATTEAGCRVIVIAADGPAFCSGLDLEAAFSNGRGPDPAFLAQFVDCLTLLCTAEQAVVACVEGKASGGGVGLAAACDIVLASAGASFILPEVIVGMMPALIAPFLLRRVSPGTLRYLALSSRGLSAEEARQLGLVDVVVAGGMDAALEQLLGRLLRSSPAAIGQSKRYFDRLQGLDFSRQRELALEQAMEWMSRADVAEGVRAFAEGDIPPWFQRVRGDK